MNRIKTLQFFVIMYCFFLLACKKDHGPVNVTLIDKSPFVIESYIAGKWKFIYTRLGLTQQTVYYPDSIFIEFDFRRNSINYIDHTTITSRTSIQWNKIENYIDGEGDLYTITDFLAVGDIYNDTLSLFQPAEDGSSYFS